MVTAPEIMRLPAIITSTPALSATTGILYTYDVNGVGTPTPTFSLVVTPSGMAIDSISGLIQWTPAGSGTYSVTVRAGNGIAPDAEQPFVIQAQDPPPNPIITSTPPLSATAGISYTYDVNATGTPTPTFSLVITPQGMTIDSVSGLIDEGAVVAQPRHLADQPTAGRFFVSR